MRAEKAMSIDTEVAEVAEMLRELRAADTRLRVFGAPSHGYRLNPVLAEDAVRAFETAHGVRLPDDYRLFVRTVGDGGAGPYYGLETLDTASQYRKVGAPFPFVPPPQDTPGDPPAGWRRHARTGILYVADDEVADWTEEGGAGTLELSHQGCAIYSFLVLTGPARGTIWDGSENLVPQDLTFLEWYRDWAVRVLRLVRNEALVERLRVGMTAAEVREAVDAAWKERPALYDPVIYFEASGIPAQLELDEERRVVRINPWQFL